MARKFEHLELLTWRAPLGGQGPNTRRLIGGGRPPSRKDKSFHGKQLVQEANQVANNLQIRMQTAPQGINPKLVFKLQLHAKGHLDEDALKRLGLRLLGRDANRAIVVFPDEATLNELRRRLQEYAGLVPGGHKYAELAAIDAITELTAADRVGGRLRATPLSPDESAALDIELWHSGNRDECWQWMNEIRDVLEKQSLALTDWWIGENLCLLRGRVNLETLNLLLEIDYVKEIDRRAKPTFEMSDVARLGVLDLEIESDLPENLVGVVIVDSGVMQQHPLLAPALGDAQVFPDRLRARIKGGAEDGDERSGGHGTAVAGIALYSDFGKCLQKRSFSASARLFSARVTDDNNEYDEESLLEHQLSEALEYFLDNYPSVKVINISLGDRRLVYSDGAYQFRFAAAIDELAYQYRERDLLFVVSAGNFFPDQLSDEEILRQYPTYLLESEYSRIIDPATAALALTVGGLSYGSGRDLLRYIERGVERVVAGEKGWPSPFTRTGWGVDGAMKPDVVEFAGDMRFERGRIVGRQPAHAGIPTTAKHFAPPQGRLFRTVAGTSFAAPRVANLAARLFREFPNASSNLIRALIADSGRIPKSRPPNFSNLKPWNENILRIYGCGQPDFARARWSAQNDVSLLVDSIIELDSFQIFTIPSLPIEFLTTRGDGYISVTLAFDPPTRHTRGDSYLGVTMEFLLFRNITPEKVVDAIRAWKPEEKKSLEKGKLPTRGDLNRHRIQMKPGPSRRKKGTLQRALVKISRSNWRYDGGPLVLAVVSQRKWAPVHVNEQRFAVVTSLYHEDPSVELYAHIQQQTRVYQRTRVRVGQLP